MPIKKTLPVKTLNSAAKKSSCGFTSGRCCSIIMYIVLVLIVIFSGLKIWLICYQFNKTIDKNAYQVVFLDNGESYFGKLENIGFKMYKLEDVYYLKQFPKTEETAGENTDQTAEQNNTDVNDQTATTASDYEVRLIRLGEQEFYKPNNSMVINRDHILYWENLQDKSDVMDFINKQ